MSTTAAASSSPAPTPAPAAPKGDNAIRAYLASIGMAPILEEFVGATVAERPDDVFAFMEAFARRKRAEASKARAWTLPQSWAATAGRNEASLAAFATNFFDLLFVTQRTMRRTVFASIADDLPAKGLALAKVLDAMVNGKVTDIELSALSATHVAPDSVPIEPYHYPAIVSALLLALRETVGPDAWAAVGDEWRTFCMAGSAKIEAAVTDAKAAAAHARLLAGEKAGGSAVQNESAADVSAASAGANSSAKEGEGGGSIAASASVALPALTAEASWDKMPMAAQQSIVASAFEVLFTQHAPLRQRLFAGVDTEALAPTLHPLLEALVRGELTDEAIIATGAVEAAAARGAQPYHVQYGVTALLMALTMALGRATWEGGEVAEVWRLQVFAAGDRFTRLLEAAIAAKETTGEAPGEATPAIDEAEL